MSQIETIGRVTKCPPSLFPERSPYFYVYTRQRSVGQGIDSNVEGEFLAVIGADPPAFVAGIIGAKGAAKSILAHDRDQIPIVKQAIQVNVARLVEAADVVEFVKRAINQVIIGNGLYLLVWKQTTKLTPPGLGEIRIGTATGTKN